MELGIEEPQAEAEPDQNDRPKTFLEMLMKGEIDWDAETDMIKQEEQNDLNAEVRILISNNFPALITLIQQDARESEDPNSEDPLITDFKTKVLPLYIDLTEDKDCLVRAACAQVLPTLCKLAWKEYAAEVFGPPFKKLLKDPNPFVVQHLLESIENVLPCFGD